MTLISFPPETHVAEKAVVTYTQIAGPTNGWQVRGKIVV
jgi:hypothetical protein